MDNYWFSARMYLTLQEELTCSTLMDATNLVNWVKTVKSDAEITYMHRCPEQFISVNRLTICKRPRTL